MNIQKVKASQLKFAEYNPRFHSEEFLKKLKRSVDEFGYIEPIIWNKLTGNIVGGHARLKALNPEPDTLIDVVVVELDEHKEKLCNIALNKISGDFDNDKLQEIFEELKQFDCDLSLSGFDEVELLEFEPETKGQIDEDETPETPETPISEFGKIYQLGKHKLMCADSTEPTNYKKLLGDELVDLIITDPPYNVNYNGGTKNKLTIMNDNFKSTGEFFNFLFDVFTNAFNVCKEGSAMYVFHSDSEGLTFRMAFVNAGFLMKQCCIWVKNALVMGRQDYQWQHEPALYGWKPGASHKWHSDRKQTTIWNFDCPKKNDIHTTMKPVNLIEYPMSNSSVKGDIVLDMFLGSGSTLIACEKIGRVCRGFELDPKYADVIRKRWAEFVHGEGCDWQKLTREIE